MEDAPCEGYTGFFIEWIEEWSQFFQSCNWYTFHPIQIEVEDERNMGGVECTLIVLGLGFRARWNYRRTEQVEDIIRQVAERPMTGFIATMTEEQKKAALSYDGPETHGDLAFAYRRAPTAKGEDDGTAG